MLSVLSKFIISFIGVITFTGNESSGKVLYASPAFIRDPKMYIQVAP